MLETEQEILHKMRTKYHFYIDEHEKDNFLHVVNRLGLEIDTAVIGHDENLVGRYDYFLSVSKYELLYIKLACRAGKYINVDEWKKNQQQQGLADSLLQQMV